MGSEQRARLAPRYWVKQAIIVVALLGLGVWGALDLFVIYPERARRFATWAEWQYLNFLDNPPASAGAGVNLGMASVPDPREAYERMGRPGYTRNPETLEDYRANWLDALSIIGNLDPAYTTFPRENPREGDVGSPYDRRDELAADWESVDRSRAPKRLSRFDILSQWPIFLGGVGLAGYFAFGLFRAMGARYAWDESQAAITLPGGVRVAADQVEEFDKSKWHKFYVALVLGESHPTHAGRRVTVDLYRHTPVEQWILEMERRRFPERFAADGQDADTSEPQGEDQDGEPSAPATDGGDTQG